MARIPLNYRFRHHMRKHYCMTENSKLLMIPPKLNRVPPSFTLPYHTCFLNRTLFLSYIFYSICYTKDAKAHNCSRLMVKGNFYNAYIPSSNPRKNTHYTLYAVTPLLNFKRLVGLAYKLLVNVTRVRPCLAHGEKMRSCQWELIKKYQSTDLLPVLQI